MVAGALFLLLTERRQRVGRPRGEFEDLELAASVALSAMLCCSRIGCTYVAFDATLGSISGA